MVGHEHDFLEEEPTEEISNKWIITPKIYGSLISQCGNRSILGGYKIFNHLHCLTRSFDFTGYPHSRIYIEFYLYLIDYWQSESLVVLINGRQVQVLTHSSRRNAYSNECGDSSNDRLVRYSGTIDHEDDIMNIEFSVNPGPRSVEDTLYYGIGSFMLRLLEVEKMNEVRLSYNQSKCKNGYFPRNVTDCNKKGYNGVYCEVCVQCEALCLICSNLNACNECRKGFFLKKGTCIAKKGTFIFITKKV